MSTKGIVKSFLKTGIRTLDEGIGDVLWVEEENVDVERDSESVPESISEDDNP
jgi:hypothetical protein